MNNIDGKDKVLAWPSGVSHRCSDAHPDAIDQAVADNGKDYFILWFPEEMDDEALDTEVHIIIDEYFKIKSGMTKEDLIELYQTKLNKVLWVLRDILQRETLDVVSLSSTVDRVTRISAIDYVLAKRQEISVDMTDKIAAKLNAGMEGQFDSRHAHPTEVATAWMLTEIDDLRAEVKHLKKGRV